MKTNNTLRALRWFAICMIAISLSAQADSSHPVSLSLESPHTADGIPLLTDNGWPIILEMTIRRDEVANDTLAADGRRTLTFQSPAGARLDVYSDVDDFGMQDNVGDAGRRTDTLVGPGLGREPHFARWDSGTNGLSDCVPGTESRSDLGGECAIRGPRTGEDVVDGYALAADDDMLGLVLVSETGAGIVYDEPSFEPMAPMTLRNMAGMNNQVSFEWRNTKEFKNSGRGKKNGELIEVSKVWATFNTPVNWLRNLVMVDPCIGDITTCTETGQGMIRVDGGPAQLVGKSDPALISIDLLNQGEFTVTAFVVSGDAPDTLSDMNNDTVVNAMDASMAGYDVISNELSFTVLQYDQLDCFGGGGFNDFFNDLDGNKSVAATKVCPTGPGRFERPPR